MSPLTKEHDVLSYNIVQARFNFIVLNQMHTLSNIAYWLCEKEMS